MHVYKVGAETSTSSGKMCYMTDFKRFLKMLLRNFVSRFSSQASRWITCRKLKLQAVGNQRHHRLLPRTPRLILQLLFFVENFLPSGTKYDFWLYYSNSTISDWLTWTGKRSFSKLWSQIFSSCSMCQSLV